MENEIVAQYPLFFFPFWHRVYAVHTISLLRYPWFPVVFVCRRPRCYWSWLGLTGGDSGLPLTHTFPCFHPSLRSSEAAVSFCMPACVRFLIVIWKGEKGGGGWKWSYYRVCKITSRSCLRSDVFLAWWLSKHPPCVHTLPPSAQKACGSQAALLFKVKLVCHVACVEFLCWRLPGIYEFLIGVLFLLLTIYEAFEKRHGKEGVEDHDEEDVKISIVVGLPHTRDGWHRRVAGPWAIRGIEYIPGSLIGTRFNTSVLKYMLASGKDWKQKGPVHAFHIQSDSRESKLTLDKQTQKWTKMTELQMEVVRGATPF